MSNQPIYGCHSCNTTVGRQGCMFHRDPGMGPITLEFPDHKQCEERIAALEQEVDTSQRAHANTIRKLHELERGLALSQFRSTKKGDPMKMVLESTTKIVTLRTDSGEVPARIWEGYTDSGIPIHAYVTRVAVKNGLPTAQFERELSECRKPSPEVEAIPLRLIL